MSSAMPSRTRQVNWTERLRASGIHFGLSMVVAALSGMLVFAVWYPYPYREISGGRELFLLVVTVDVILGPLVTMAVFDVRKSRWTLALDLGVVVMVQVAALAYGLWTVAVARPVHLVFEFDRFRIVHAIDVPMEMLGKAEPGIRPLPWSGPTPLAVRPFKDANEKFEATVAALGGAELAARPDFWQSYDAARGRVLEVSRPVGELKRRFPANASEIDAALRATGRTDASAVYLPVVGRKSFWTAFIDPVSAEVVAFIPLDPF